MSSHFEKVKSKLLKDIESGKVHNQISWANIILKHAAHIRTIEDQKSFWNFLMNPNDNYNYTEPKFEMVDLPEKVLIHKFEKMTVKDEEDEKTGVMDITLENTHHLNGLTSYIQVTPLSDMLD